MAQFPAPEQGIVVAHLIVSDDVERSRRFYTEVLVGETVSRGEPIYVALANSWIIINVGGGPTDDKPTVILETPADPDRVSSFLNIRGCGHRGGVQGVEREGRRVSHATDPAGNRDPLLHPRSGWPTSSRWDKPRSHRVRRDVDLPRRHVDHARSPCLERVHPRELWVVSHQGDVLTELKDR